VGDIDDVVPRLNSERVALPDIPFARDLAPDISVPRDDYPRIRPAVSETLLGQGSDLLPERRLRAVGSRECDATKSRWHCVMLRQRQMTGKAPFTS
jgi:hypothetical protein